MNIFKIAFNQLNKFECIQKYWFLHNNEYSYESKQLGATRQHIRNSFIISWILILLCFLHPLLFPGYFLGWVYYAFLNELWFQYSKDSFLGDGKHNNKLEVLWWVMAQIFERSSGFVVCLPLFIVVIILTWVFGFKII